MPITAAATVASAAIGAGGSYLASQKQAKAAKAAQALQMQMFNEGKGWMMPFIQGGQGAFEKLSRLYGIGPDGKPLPGGGFGPEALAEFERSPDYQFALKTGNDAIRNQYSRIYGGVRGGNQMRGIADYNQGAATQNFGNYRSALESLSRMGLGAAGQAMGAGQGYAQNMGNMELAKGQAAASGIVGATNAISGAITSGANNYNFNQYMKSAYGQPGTYTPAQFNAMYASATPTPAYQLYAYNQPQGPT